VLVEGLDGTGYPVTATIGDVIGTSTRIGPMRTSRGGPRAPSHMLDRALTLESWGVDVDTSPLWGQHDLPADAESKARDVAELLQAAGPT
jgi:hypothetical protein